MKTPLEHIEHIKGKPHHIRKNIAYGVAGATTAVVALVWLVASLSTNAFAITGSSFAESTGQTAVVVTSPGGNGDPNIAGAAAATLPSDPTAPAHIEIVNTNAASSTATPPPEKTRLSF